MIKVCLIGVGKAGKEVAKLLYEQSDIEIVAAVCPSGSPKIHKDLGDVIGTHDTGVRIAEITQLEQIILRHKPHVVVDFSAPQAVMDNFELLAKMRVNMVIGTTGFSDSDIEMIENLTYRYHIGVVYAPNISLGVNVLMVLSNLAAVLLNNYDFCITEVHHKNKKDIPSGTALKIANEIKNGLSCAEKTIPEDHIPINSVRAGGVVGKHEVMIVGEHDKITIAHESFSRTVFALGALKAVRFLPGKAGFYGMNDVLTLSKVIEDLYMQNIRQDSQKFKKLYMIK